jgi:hypothetical protein
MKTTLLFLLTLTLVLLLSMVAMAQPGLPGDPAQAPIDGGLGLLAAAGGLYAYKKIKNRDSDTI